MTPLRATAYWTLTGLFISLPLRAAEPKVDPQRDLPRFPAVEPADAVKTFTVKKGFHVDLVAHEPEVMSPIAMSFDENGRLFVVEMRDYSELRDVHPHMGRIRLLEDTDGDGVFDKATIYADDLPWPTGVICYHGGIFVAASPDVIWLKDTKGDGHADERKVVFTGYGADKEKLNVQALLNSFNWGLDNRIHGATGPNGGASIRNLMQSGDSVAHLGRNDFKFDPRTFTLEPELGGGQYGLSYDTRGRKFVCSNSHHLQALMYDIRYASRNPYYTMPPALEDIAVDGPAAEVYRTSPEEPWRVLRTKWRVSGVVKGMIEGGGRSAGYFTGATGATIYRGNAFPADFLNNAFIGDAGGNLVHRKLVRENGVEFVAERPADEQHMEFASSNDTWFRPVQFFNAPDGCLYIADMYREVIEHPWSLPASIKQYLDLNSGNDRGRIYRLTPDGFKQPKLPRLGQATTAELVATLAHPNSWHRETAARLLYERQDRSAVPALERLALTSPSPLGRMHALHTLEGLQSLSDSLLLHALTDKNAVVRDHAIQLAEPRTRSSASLRDALVEMAGDSDAWVRYQLAFTLGEFSHQQRLTALARIAETDIDSRWTRAAVFSSLKEGAGDLFVNLSAKPAFQTSATGQEWLRELAQMIGAANQPVGIKSVLGFLHTVGDPALAFSLVHSFGDGLQRAHTSLQKIDADGTIHGLFSQARQVAADTKAAEGTRVLAIQLLGLTSYTESGLTLLGLLALEQPQPVQSAALAALDRFPQPELGGELAQRWPQYTTRLRSEVLGVLLKRKERSLALVEAIGTGTIRRTDLTSSLLKQLQEHRDPQVRELALKTLGPVSTSTREQVIKAYATAMDLPGDAQKGRLIYRERCSSCHRMAGEGFQLGPDFVTVQNSGKEKLLTNILDPNREVAPQYLATQIDTKDGETLTGIVVNESTASVTLRMSFGNETVVSRNRIARMQSSGQSLMPDGLENGLTPQDFANLLEFIITTR